MLDFSQIAIVIMKYKRAITSATVAEQCKKYPILNLAGLKIGEATFLDMEDEEFVFDMHLENPVRSGKYIYLVDLDIDTNELVSFRASLA